MELCTDCCEYGELLDSAALMQGLRRLAQDKSFKTRGPRPCPARRPRVGNDFKTIITARLQAAFRRWQR